MIAALFDCDGTLYTGRFGLGVMTYAARHGRWLQSRWFYISLMPATILSRLKLMSGTAFDQAVMDGVASLVKGYNPDQLADLFGWIVRDYLLPTQRTDIMAKLKGHVQKGHAVILVSGSFQGAVDVLSKVLGITGGVGTGITMADGVCAGRIAPPLVKDEHKAALAREFCTARGLNVDWAASYAYADSISDQHMLELVGHPTAVYPDRKLTVLAQANGWETIGTPRERS